MPAWPPRSLPPLPLPLLLVPTPPAPALVSIPLSSHTPQEADLAIVADMGTLQRLPALVGHGVAAELALTARAFSGEGRAPRAAEQPVRAACALHRPSSQLAASAAVSNTCRPAARPNLTAGRHRGEGAAAGETDLCRPGRTAGGRCGAGARHRRQEPAGGGGHETRAAVSAGPQRCGWPGLCGNLGEERRGCCFLDAGRKGRCCLPACLLICRHSAHKCPLSLAAPLQLPRRTPPCCRCLRTWRRRLRRGRSSGARCSANCERRTRCQAWPAGMPLHRRRLLCCQPCTALGPEAAACPHCRMHDVNSQSV